MLMVGNLLPVESFTLIKQEIRIQILKIININIHKWNKKIKLIKKWKK